jgi:hypothetical protein
MNANTFKVVAAIAVAVLAIGVVVANFAVPVSAQGNMTNATAPNATNATMANATSGGGAQGSSGGGGG